MAFKIRAHGLLAGVFFLLCIPAELFGQVERGAIAGRVADTTGASIPEVEISVVNVLTGVESRTVTNEAGQFVALNLIPGRYRVSASRREFKTFERQDLIVRANERLAVDLTLEVGEVTETVEVRGELAPLLQKESSTLTSVLETKEISELPLRGRTVFQLAPLTAGVTSGRPEFGGNRDNIPDNARAPQGFSVNGQNEGNNTQILDGVYNNQVNQGMIAILPPLEAIQQFSMETSNFLPEVGRGGAVMNVTLKSGTNQFHGQLFNVHRNAAMDARNFFDRQTPQNPRRLPNVVKNQFGFVFGGPIDKDKTFFFGDFQGMRDRQGQTFVTTIPGQAIRGGDFRGTARPVFDPGTYDPVARTRQPFPNQIIDPSRFNPASKAVLDFLPLPNGPLLANGEGLFYSSPSRRVDQESFDIKIDHRLNAAHSLTGRFSYGASEAAIPGSFSDDPKFATAVGIPVSGRSPVFPGNVSNPARSVALQWIYNISPTILNEFRTAYIRAGARATQPNFGKKLADQLGIPNVNVTEENSGFPGITVSGLSAIGDTAAYPLVKMENGYQFLNNTTLIHGSHTFKWGMDYKVLGQNVAQITTYPAGVFSFNGSFTANPNQPATTGNSFADFLLGVPISGDLARIAGTVGLRWKEFAPYWQDTWRVSTRLTVNYGVRYELITPLTEVADRLTNFDLLSAKLLLPGQGGSLPGYETRALVRSDKNNFAPRLGLAFQLNQKTVLRAAYGIFYMTELKLQVPRLAANPPFVGGVNYINTALPQQINRTLDQGLPVTDPFIPIDQYTGSIGGVHPDSFTAYTQQWNLSIQRELASSLVWEARYVGNNSNHVLDLYNPNQPYPGTGAVTARQPYFPLVGRNFSLNFREQRGKANYNGLQTSLTKRYSGGVSFLSSYTWSHGIDNTSHQDARNLDADRGNSGNDVRHRFTFGGLYELPFGRGKSIASNASGLVNAFVGGWQLGSVAVIQGGLPFTVTGGAGRPNRTCDGSLADPTPNKWFDASCFPLPAAVTDPVRGGLYIPFGNSGTYVLTGDGIFNIDLSAAKTIKVSEGTHFELRGEFTNAFNHSQFYNPLSAVNTGTTAQVVTAREARQVQLVLKFIF